MSKVKIVFISLFCFGLGYFVKYKSVENEGWKTFNSKKWISFEDGVHGKNYRKKMVFSLVNNVLDHKNDIHFKKTKTVDDLLAYKSNFTINKIFKLLGSEEIIPLNNNDEFTVTYQVEEKYGWNIDPEGGTILQLNFDKDSIFQNWRIVEFWYKP